MDEVRISVCDRHTDVPLTVYFDKMTRYSQRVSFNFHNLLNFCLLYLSSTTMHYSSDFTQHFPYNGTYLAEILRVEVFEVRKVLTEMKCYFESWNHLRSALRILVYKEA